MSKSALEVFDNTLVPMVIEQTSRGERSFDIFPGFKRTHHLSDRRSK